MRKFLSMAALGVGAILLAGPRSAHADPVNLVVNGNFDSPIDIAYGWDATGNGAAFTTGSVDGYTAHSGTHYVMFGSDVPVNGGIYQDVTTTPGDTYQLSYFMASDGDLPNEFKVSENTTVLSDLTDIPKQNWTQYTFDFQASTTSTELLFGGSDNTGWLALDDITLYDVTAAPLPSTALAGVGLLSGLAVLMLARRRKAATAPQSN